MLATSSSSSTGMLTLGLDPACSLINGHRMTWRAPRGPALPPGQLRRARECGARVRLRGAQAVRQGLTLVHFSAQTEPFLNEKLTLHTPYYTLTPPKHPLNAPLILLKVLKLSRHVD